MTDRWDIPALYEGVWAKREKSRVAAMKAMCLQCMGWDRKSVTDCKDDSCALHSWRPYQDKGETDE